jgi:L-alanine-DL-glutamate epimerase-like enolase superfamily enzyme
VTATATTAAAVATAGVVSGVRAAAYRIPTDAPESDGTFAWDATTLVVVEVEGGGERGLGYTYGDAAVAGIAAGALATAVEGTEVLDTGAAHAAAEAALRNIGRTGPGAMALSALDVALHDLRARVLGVPLWRMLGPVRDHVPIYGSGGFTSYDDGRLADQLTGWVRAGIPRVKMKVGREPARDLRRVEVARAAVGEDVELMVDANGAYDRAPALRWAERFAERGVTWLEEPVSSDDVAGMALVRDRAPRGLEIAAGEYVWRECDALALAGAVDVLQVDVTRCGGVTSTLRIDALARAHSLPTSIHCAPAVSAHVGAAMATLRHLEYFHDHVRIERMLFDGAPDVGPGGVLTPSPDRPGLGLELRRADAERWRA